MKDNVNHPDHYQNIAGVETIDILNDVVKDLPGKQAAMLWNSMKYLFRFQKKNGVEDLKKARNYLDYLINDIEATNKVANSNGLEILWDTWNSDEYGRMGIYSKTKKPNGMPSKLVFDTQNAAEEFQSVFYNLLSEGYDEFSITDVALEMKYRTTKGNQWNNWDEPINWKEKLFARFIMLSVGEKWLLDFVYKEDALDTLEEMQPTNDVHVLCKSTVWGSADVYYSTELLKGTCTKILFNDIDARNTFALKFFKYLSHENSGFSIRELLDDLKYLWGEDDDNLSIDVPWKDIFKGFYMGEEGGKYSLEFIFDQEEKVMEATKHYPDFKCDLESEEKETKTDDDIKAKVDKAIIVVAGTKEEPYFEILYHLIGEDDDRLGFGSYCLTNVFNWRDQHLDIVNKEDK